VSSTDIYVKIAECYLEEDDAVEADSWVNKAGSSVEAIGGGGRDGGEGERRKCVPLILRYKSVYARVLDANRRFLQAAEKYYWSVLEWKITTFVTRLTALCVSITFTVQ